VIADCHCLAAEVRPFQVRAFDAEGCSMYRWRTDECGLIWVSKDGAPEFVPTLRGANALGMESVIARWSDMARVVAERWGLPVEWILSMVWRESAGNPRAFRREPNGWTGIGLLQITHPSLKGGLIDEQVFDPQTNLEIGARYIARSIVAKYGRDFPKISAAFNAGSVRHSDANEWQMVCTGNHVDAEVGALNYQILRSQQEMQRATANAVAVQFDLQALVDVSPHHDAHDTEPSPPPDAPEDPA
jgi:hypothetical protein